MAHMRRFLVVLLVGLAFAGMAAGPAHAQAERPGGPTVGDFTDDGVFDQDSYLAAFIAFQTAPSIAAGSTVALNIDGCGGGETVTAELLGQSTTRVSGVASSGGEVVLRLAIPDGTEPGFNRIRIVCGSLIRDLVVNVVAPGSPDAVTSIDVDMVDTDDGGGGAGTGGGRGGTGRAGTLPRTGEEVRNLVGGGVAALLMGAALVLGVRQRLQTDSV